jgi:murein DD-endopeptidase MepM/ murein hydrolase activator NlpD
LSFQPFILLALFLCTISLPLLGITKVIYSYAQRNSQLTRQNNQLSNKAADILQQVEMLEGEVKNLQERAGVSNSKSPSPPSNSASPQGGVGVAIEAEMLLAIAKAKLPNLWSNLRGNVKPALEETLDREAARPKGIPLKTTKVDISSGFGLRRNPFGWNYEFHNGLDFAGDYGSPVYVTAPGVVIEAEWSDGYGYHVIVDHGYGYQTLYAHLSATAVTLGMQIERDRIVGYLGNTGRSSGPHLHYTIYHNNKAVDPMQYLNLDQLSQHD